jgi:hypothetical protein
MKLPVFPTDNLYKFMALFGIAILISKRIAIVIVEEDNSTDGNNILKMERLLPANRLSNS